MSEEIRITTSEVCALAKFSSVTLWRRIRSGRMPAPIDKGRELIFDRAAVMAALATVKATSDIRAVIQARQNELAAKHHGRDTFTKRCAWLKS